jgi:hypothetical protein
MNADNKDYLNEYIYDYIDDLCESSEKYRELSGNLKDRLSELFDSIEDEDCNEMLCDIDEIYTYLIKLNSLSTNELTMIKNNGKILINKHLKHKEKIMSLKTKNKMLEEELQDANEQKENTLTKLNELNDEFYKLYEEKKNIELNISIKENEENQKQKLNNELLSDEINNLNDKIKYLNKQIKSYEEKVNNLSKKNKEEAENISQMKKELVCKDEVIKMTIEKFNKLNEEKEKIRLNNRELERSIEDFKNQCKDYQIIINYSNEQIKELKEKLNKQEQTNEGRKISLNSLLEDEEEKEKAREREAQISDLNNINNDINENINLEEIKELRRNAVDYTGKEINLNELIFEESESAEHEAVEKKNKIKLAFTRVKNVRRFNKLKSLNYNYKLLNFGENYEKKHKSRKNVRFNELSNINELNEFNRDLNGRLKTIKHQKSNLSNTKILYKMMNSKSQCNYVENDEKFLYELLFNSIDL